MYWTIPRRAAGLGIALLAGLVVGILLPVILMQVGMTSWLGVTFPERGVGSRFVAHHEEDHDHEVEEMYDHIDVSRAARQSLGLQRAMVTPRSFTSRIQVPAAVVERPGVSDLHVVTRFEGIVEEILAVPGQAVREGEPLFRIRLTGDSLAGTQAALLDAVQQVAILDQEIERLRSAVQQGGLAGRSLLELEYERRRLLARKRTKRQELMIRGLDEEQISQITDSEELVRSVTIQLPSGLTEQISPYRADELNAWPFTIEGLAVTPGSFVRQGDPLCNLAYHARLFLEGYAFERDIETIATVIENRLPVVAELGEALNPLRLDDLRVIHLDNHVDSGTQTYRFYVELKNEILQDSLREDGRRYRTWRYKPGQRGHIGLPAQYFDGVFVLPSEAVVMDGLQPIVFRRQPSPGRAVAVLGLHDDRRRDQGPYIRDQQNDLPSHVSPDQESESQHSDVADTDVADTDDESDEEYVPVPIQVLYRDRQVVVASADGQLRTGDVIAINSAYQLLLAMKSGDGGQHDHHHDH